MTLLYMKKKEKKIITEKNNLLEVEVKLSFKEKDC